MPYPFSTRFLCLLALCNAAWSTENPTQPAQLEEVLVTASRRPETTFESGKAAAVVNSNQLLTRQPNLLPELLRGQAGVYVQQTTPGQAAPIVRGLKGSQVLHMVDGMRLNNAVFRSAPNQYFALLDSAWLEQLELVRGPASTLHGGDAMGGAVQVLTREPELQGEDWHHTIRLTSRYASAELLRRFHIGADVAKRTVGFTTDLSYQRTGNRKLAGGERIAPTGFEVGAATAKALFHPDNGAEWMVSVQYLKQPETPRIDELVPGFGEDEAGSELFNFEPNDRLFAQLRYRRALDRKWADNVEFHLGHQLIHDDRRSRATGSDRERREHNSSALSGLTIQLNRTFDNGVDLVYGGEYYTDLVRSRRMEQVLSDGTEFEKSSRFPDGSRMESSAAFAHSYLDWGERTSLNAGVRASRYTIQLEAGPENESARLEPSDLTASLGWLYQLSDSLNLVASLGRGFRPPNIFDLGTIGARPGNRFNIANPNLAPESVVTLDWGIKWSGNRFSGELFAFVSDYQDKITSVATGEITDEGRVVVQSHNANQVKLSGIELAARYQLHEQQWSGVLNYIEGEEKYADGHREPADRTPPLNGRISYRRPIRHDLELSLEMLFAARQDRLSARDIGDPRINPEGTPGWGRSDIGLVWSLTEAATVTARLENLFDKRYRDHGSGIDAPGRNLVLGMSLIF